MKVATLCCTEIVPYNITVSEDKEEMKTGKDDSNVNHNGEWR